MSYGKLNSKTQFIKYEWSYLSTLLYVYLLLLSVWGDSGAESFTSTCGQNAAALTEKNETSEGKETFPCLIVALPQELCAGKGMDEYKNRLSVLSLSKANFVMENYSV